MVNGRIELQLILQGDVCSAGKAIRLFGAVTLQIRANRTKSPEHQHWNGELSCALNFHRQFQPMSIEVPLSCLDAL